MPAVRKNTGEQEALLKSEFPDYETAKGKQRLMKFWPRMEAKYFAAFPERTSLVAKGLISSEKDDELTQEEQEIIANAISDRKKSLKGWFRRESKLADKARAKAGGNKKSPEAVITSLFGLHGRRRRRHQATEIFQQLYPKIVKKAWKAAIQTELRRCAGLKVQGDNLSNDEADISSGSETESSESDSESETDEGEKAERKMAKKTQKLDRSVRMKLRRDVVGKLWAGATEEAKQAVAKAQAREADEQDSQSIASNENERTPDEYDAAIDNLEEVLTRVFTAVEVEAGWSITAILGGPCPKRGGDLVVQTISWGRNLANKSFTATYPEYQKALVDPYTAWLKEKYPRSIRKRRALSYDIPEAASLGLDGLISMNNSGTTAPGSSFGHEDPMKLTKRKTSPVTQPTPSSAVPHSAFSDPHEPFSDDWDIPATDSSQDITINDNIDPFLLAEDARRAEEGSRATKEKSTPPRPKPAFKGHLVSNAPIDSGDALSTTTTMTTPANTLVSFGGFNFPSASPAFTTPATPSPGAAHSSINATPVTSYSSLPEAHGTPIPISSIVVTPALAAGDALSTTQGPGVIPVAMGDINATSAHAAGAVPASAKPGTGNDMMRQPLGLLPPTQRPPPFESRPPTKKPATEKPATQPKAPAAGKGGRKRKSTAGKKGVGRKKRKTNNGEAIQGEDRGEQGEEDTPLESLQFTTTSNNAKFAKTSAAAAKKKAKSVKANLVNADGEHPLVVFPAPPVPVGPAPAVSSRGRKITRGTNRDGTLVELPVKRGRAGK